MTRKDFNAIAKAFSLATQDIKDSTLLPSAGEQLDALIGLECALARVIDVLAASNPNFDRGRFVLASAAA